MAEVDGLFDPYTAHENLVSEVFGEVTEMWTESVLPTHINRALLELIATLPRVDFKSRLTESIDNSLELSTLSQQEIEKLLAHYVGHELPYRSDAVIDVQNWIADTFQDQLRSPVTFVNSRAWSNVGSEDFGGPFHWHTDGFKPGHLKVMIYPGGLSESKGGLEIGDTLITNRPPGAAVMFRNSDVNHRGIPATGGGRLAVEITLQRSLFPQLQRWQSHFNGRHLKSLQLLYVTAGNP